MHAFPSPTYYNRKQLWQRNATVYILEIPLTKPSIMYVIPAQQ